MDKQLMRQVGSWSFIIGVLIAILVGGFGGYIFYYKPHKELEEFKELIPEKTAEESAEKPF